MAKKNSTKTATKEAWQASEPKVQTFKQWSGINIKEAPLGWNPIESTRSGYSDTNQTDLPMNFLVVQNNICTTSSKALETRNETELVANAPAGESLTGVVHLRGEHLFAACESGSIYMLDLSDESRSWYSVPIVDADDDERTDFSWTCIESYQTSLCAMAYDASTETGEMFLGDLALIEAEDPTGILSSVRELPNPSAAPALTKRGSLEDGDVSRVSICYTYCSKLGYTLGSQYATGYYATSPVEWSAAQYVEVSGGFPSAPPGEDPYVPGIDIVGVDLYCIMDENQDEIFIGHVDVTPGMTSWRYNWLGALMDTSQWSMVPLTIPEENSTKGVDAAFMNHHDGRLYFWGGHLKYRLWIGGNPGTEFSVARGVGGGYVDIEPGSGAVIHHTHKFKTYNGASIVTVMCGNENTGKVKRFNLLETNVSVTNEYTSTGFMTEEVSNVVGCNSDYGSGVWADGLYAVSRYGLALTTQAMESQNQLRATLVSDVIQPVFTDRISDRLSNARMMYSDEIIYLVLAEEGRGEEDPELDHVILCYDINQKAWYTFTIEGQDHIRHVFNFDSDLHWEGIGIVCSDCIKLIPNTSDNLDKDVELLSIIETGDLSSKTPTVATLYVAQLEFRFDYFIGDAEIIVEGVDYYGRHIKLVKDISWDTIKRDLTEWLRVDHYLENYRITIRSKAHFRMTHINAKCYTESNRIGLVYGFDARSSYINPGETDETIHHILSSYNDLREAIVP